MGNTFADKNVPQQLAYIKSNFERIIPATKELQTQELTLSEVANILLRVRNCVDRATGEVGEIVRQKYDLVFGKNPGFKKIRQIGSVLAGTNIPDFNMPPGLIARYKYAPLTSSDVERSFSCYKTILTDRRTNFTKKNLEMYLVCYCNFQNQFKDFAWLLSNMSQVMITILFELILVFIVQYEA